MLRLYLVAPFVLVNIVLYQQAIKVYVWSLAVCLPMYVSQESLTADGDILYCCHIKHI